MDKPYKLKKYLIYFKSWEWEIYKDHVKGVGSGVGGSGGVASLTDEQKFCGWKKIQHKIFETLTQQITGTTTYTWDDDVLPLINIKEKTVLGTTKNCDNITVNLSKISELKDNGHSSPNKSSPTNCKGINIAEGLHIPLRRRALLVEGIDEYLKGIKDEITNEQTLKEVLGGKTSAQMKIGNTAIEMKKEMIEGISKAISDLIKDKYKDTEHDVFCKEWYRTMEDYHTLLLGDDIVNENKTKEIQCTIKQIEKNVGGEDKFKHEWSRHFKNIVQGLQTKEFTNKITQKPCQISYDGKSQCVRFFEEWAEEFCALKRNLGNMVVEECGGASGGGNNCNGLCNMYEKFMKESEPYFENYKTLCVDTKYGNGATESELKESVQKAAANSTKECCTDFGDCSPTQLFNLTEDISNIRYKCFCEKGDYYKQRHSENKCKNLLNPDSTVVTGQVVDPPSLGTASQTVGGTPACDIVKSLLQGKSGNEKVDGCNRKEGSFDWKCEGKVKNGENGACMPPRRQKLCVYNLTQENETNTSEKLKDAFIKCAAKETFFLWHKYKEDKEKENSSNKPEDELKKGNIPPEFIRQMFYTLGDFRDLCLGTDMGNDDGTKVSGNVKKILDKEKDTKYNGKSDDEKRKTWWKTIEKNVWEAMVCALSYSGGKVDTATQEKLKGNDKNNYDKVTFDDTSGADLTTFVARPQFLRWAAEWSEDFCHKRKKLVEEVKTACQKCKNASDKYHETHSVDKNSGSSTSGAPGKKCDENNGNNDKDCKECNTKCQACKEACDAYKNFVSSTGGGGTTNDWRKQWENMKKYLICEKYYLMILIM
uniref:EMP1-like protein n=1 Tax=Plasmodium gaboni TaxID=647221 RepID=A0A0N7IKZ4_9APIC|nr:EMP1-like protein [Plasmodium gaboni]